MRRVFHIIKGKHKGRLAYSVYDLAGKRHCRRIRKNHAREVVKCLDRGYSYPTEAQQFVRDLVRMRVRHYPGKLMPWVIETCRDSFPIRHFRAQWAAVAHLGEYNEIRRAKLKNRELSEEDKLIDGLMRKWLVSDGSTAYGDLVEEAKRKLSENHG